jgi:hypothetical protein
VAPSDQSVDAVDAIETNRLGGGAGAQFTQETPSAVTGAVVVLTGLVVVVVVVVGGAVVVLATTGEPPS